MAFETSDTKLTSINDASALLNDIRSAYGQLKAMQLKLARYTSNTDPVFNAVINATFTPAERTALGAMLTPVTTLVNQWETNNRDLLKLP